MKLKYAKLHQSIFIPNADGPGKGVTLKETLEIGSKISAMSYDASVVFITSGKTTVGIPITNFQSFVIADEA